VRFALYFSTAPAPEALTRELRGGQQPWLIEGPGVHLEPQEIAKRCEPILKLSKRSPGEKK
jgi:hypothetical protein